MGIQKQVVAFCHFKGGVGTSFIASNVALELAKKKNLVCLIDFDTKHPNCANILGIEIKKKNSMYRYFNNNNPDLRSEFFVVDKKISPYLYLISSSSEDDVEILEDLNDINSDVEELLNVAKETFDIVIIDLPIDYQNPQVIESIQKSDKVLAVGDLDINTIENTFRSLQMYKSINIPLSKFIYIPNRYFDNNDITISTIKDTLGVMIGPSIQYDYKAVFESIIRSKPIVNSKHKIATAILKICELITGHISFSDNVSEKGSSKFGFNNSKDDNEPTKFTLVFDEEGEKSDGNS